MSCDQQWITLLPHPYKAGSWEFWPIYFFKTTNSILSVTKIIPGDKFQIAPRPQQITPRSLSFHQLPGLHQPSSLYDKAYSSDSAWHTNTDVLWFTRVCERQLAVCCQVTLKRNKKPPFFGFLIFFLLFLSRITSIRTLMTPVGISENLGKKHAKIKANCHIHFIHHSFFLNTV